MLPVQRHGRLLSAAIKTILAASAYSMLASAAIAQEATSATQLDEVVVTGFRASLEEALDVKRTSAGMVDVIMAEDIADFPDLNLAESLQRIPGVAIDRDGGEGRTIVVRGLGADFTRVRLNGLEALATTGGKDSSGGSNRGRGFDFNVFASDLFSSITVRKSQSADVEEGSLGATVDLQTGRPFDYEDFTLAFSGQVGYNDLATEYDPRATFLIADQWLDRRLGALLSVAYTQRHTLEEGSSTVQWENPTVAGQTAGLFQSGPAGVNSAWHPRIPRYGRLTYDQDRLGITAAIQAQPWDSTKLTFDALYAKLDGSRQEEYLEAISFSRSGQGNPQTDVTTAIFDDQGNLIAGVFNDVDVRSEQRIDELSTEFTQFSLGLEQALGDRWTLNALIGTSKSFQDIPVQTTISIERYDTDGYTYDYRGNQRLPRFDYGSFDVTDPSNWVFSSSTALGDASLIRMRPQSATNTFDTGSIDIKWNVTDSVDLKGGLLFKKYSFESVEERRYGPTSEPAVPLPPGVTLASVTQLMSGFGRNINVPSGTPTTWLVPNVAAFADALGIYCNCINQYGDFRVSIVNQLGAQRQVSEKDSGVFVQADFDWTLASMPLRGNIGARYVETDMTSFGYTGSTPQTIERSYDDFLPALNLVLEVREDLLVRLGAAKVIARPQLQNMSPGGTISTANQTLTVGNPYLDPIRANTIDTSIEWYHTEGGLISLGLFYKDITSYIQSTDETMPFGETGQPLSLLPPAQNASTPYTVRQQNNTSGGPLQGIEVSYQQPFTFLPAPFDGFGAILNYTYVQSDITYLLGSANPLAPSNPAATVMTPVENELVNLSPVSWNATLYYENDRFTVRASAAYRDEYLIRVPGGRGTDMGGKFETLNVDMSATFSLTEQFELTFEGINLTDEFDDRWQSSQRQNSESYEHSGRQFFAGFRYKL